MKKLLVVFTLLFSFSALAARPTHKSTPKPLGTIVHDGLWWRNRQAPYKEGYITGYRQALLKSNASSDILNTHNEQIISGIDALYKDFRNLNITVEDAIPYVLDELKGVSDDTLKAELQKLRQTSAANHGEE